MSVFISILNGLLLVISLYKLMYFMRVFAGIAFVMQICVNIAATIIPFVALTIGLLVIFTVAYTIANMGYSDPTGEYASVGSPFLAMMLYVYQTT